MSPVTFFLCGDVMTGRGLDQIQPHPSDPALHESWIKDARAYVELAERQSGPIPRSVAPSYVWGDALEVLETVRPAARVVNLETSITRSDAWEAKGLNYRMHPDNVACLTAAGIDVAVLANNHVLDWGEAGLVETLSTLRQAGLRVAGAGLNLREAREPAIVEHPRGRLLVYGLGSPTSGIPPHWAATDDRPGLEVVALSEQSALAFGERVRDARREGDVVVASIHWGSNWGFEVPEEYVAFAHRLVDEGADVVHGHSSHHIRPVEVYRGRLVLYGCGDFLNDYEGISGHEAFRGDLSLMYFPTVDGSGELVGLRMAPMQTYRFRLRRPAPPDVRWLEETLARISRLFGSGVTREPDGSLTLQWQGEGR